MTITVHMASLRQGGKGSSTRDIVLSMDSALWKGPSAQKSFSPIISQSAPVAPRKGSLKPWEKESVTHLILGFSTDKLVY